MIQVGAGWELIMRRSALGGSLRLGTVQAHYFIADIFFAHISVFAEAIDDPRLIFNFFQSLKLKSSRGAIVDCLSEN